MSRLRDAWLALRGTPFVETVTERVEVEKEKRVFVGEAVYDVFIAFSLSYNEGIKAAMYGGVVCGLSRPDWHGKAFRSCSDAFKVCGEDASVETQKALIVGDKAYLLTGAREVDLQPKPKIAKGKAA